MNKSVHADLDSLLRLFRAAKGLIGNRNVVVHAIEGNEDTPHRLELVYHNHKHGKEVRVSVPVHGVEGAKPLFVGGDKGFADTRITKLGLMNVGDVYRHLLHLVPHGVDKKVSLNKEAGRSYVNLSHETAGNAAFTYDLNPIPRLHHDVLFADRDNRGVEPVDIKSYGIPDELAGVKIESGHAIPGKRADIYHVRTQDGLNVKLVKAKQEQKQ